MLLHGLCVVVLLVNRLLSLKTIWLFSSCSVLIDSMQASMHDRVRDVENTLVTFFFIGCGFNLYIQVFFLIHISTCGSL